MAHVIDSFVVELGLDASKFNAQQKQVVENAKRSVDQSRRQAAEFERHADNVSDVISGITRRAAGMFAVLTGASGLTQFVAGTIHAGAEVGRLSRAIGVSANEITKWQGVAREFGSTGEAMASSFKQISNVFTAWQVGGPEAPGVMQIFRVINTEAERLDKNNAKIIDGTKGVTQSYRDLADNLKIIQTLGKENLASYLAGKIPGMDAGLFDALIQGGAKLEEILKKIEGQTDSTAEASGRLERRWNALKVSAENAGMRALFGTIDFATNAWDSYISGGRRPWGSGSFTQPALNSTPLAQGSPSGGFKSKDEKLAFIRAEAVRQGQNPDVWAKLTASEGLNKYQGDYDATGKPTSFGAMQLHYPGIGKNTADGLGTLFTRETGLDARNPETERQQIAWAMNYAKNRGLRDWHGWKGAEFANMQGVPQGSSSTTSSVTNYNAPITINAGPNASAAEIAAKLREHGMRRQQEGNQSPVGGE